MSDSMECLLSVLIEESGSTSGSDRRPHHRGYYCSRSFRAPLDYWETMRGPISISAITVYSFRDTDSYNGHQFKMHKVSWRTMPGHIVMPKEWSFSTMKLTFLAFQKACSHNTKTSETEVNANNRKPEHFLSMCLQWSRRRPRGRKAEIPGNYYGGRLSATQPPSKALGSQWGKDRVREPEALPYLVLHCEVCERIYATEPY